MPTRTAQDWVLWIYDNNPSEAVGLTKSKIAKLTTTDAVEYCQDYINAMIKKDGKRNILYQEKQMIHQLGLEA